MSDLPITPSESVPAEFDGDVFAEWIAGASIAKRSVPIYGKPGLFAEFQELERQHDAATAAAELGGGDEMGGGEVAQIEARMRELHAEWVASKSTWTVRALDDKEIESVDQADPEQGLEEITAPEKPIPPAPVPALPAGASPAAAKAFGEAVVQQEAARAAYVAAMQQYTPKAVEYGTEHNLRVIALATEKIEFGDGRTLPGITVAQLRTMRAALGERQILTLSAAVQLAVTEEPEIPAPFSRASSETPPN